MRQKRSQHPVQFNVGGLYLASRQHYFYFLRPLLLISYFFLLPRVVHRWERWQHQAPAIAVTSVSQCSPNFFHHYRLPVVAPIRLLHRQP